MKDLPLVSIIAVCYNHAKYLVETLDSIKNQTYSNVELIIMDDCSTDNSVEVIQDWINQNNYECKFIAHQENKGLCPTLNEALSVIQGEYYQLAACDDLLLPNKIELQVKEFLRLDEDYAVIYSDAIFMDDNSQELYGRFIQRCRPNMIKVPSGNLYQEFIHSNFIPAISVLMKTEIIKNIGGYDERITYEDYDMWLRLSKTYKFQFIKDVTCKYRFHDNNMHSSKGFENKSLINSFYIFSKHLDNNVALEKLKDVILKMYQNGIHKNYKEEILALGIDSKLILFIKKDVSYQNYKRATRVNNWFFKS